STDSLARQINEFHNDQETDQTFINWFKNCEDIFRNGLANILVYVKAGLLLRRLGITAHEMLKGFINCRTISNLTIDKIILINSDLFTKKSSELLTLKNMMKTRWLMLTASKVFWDFENFGHFEESFQMSTITE
ncbi:unnamed protein product, partial [Hymenolepis diminuta]